VHSHKIKPITHLFKLQITRFFFLNSYKFEYYLIIYIIYIYVLNFICLYVWLLLVMLKSQFWKRSWAFRTTRRLTVSILARTKASFTEPLDQIAHICMIVTSRAWLGWLLHYYLHYSLIVVSCLACILWFLYDLIWVCICRVLFLICWMHELSGYDRDVRYWDLVEAV
jgi:hypothetical protein